MVWQQFDSLPKGQNVEIRPNVAAKVRNMTKQKDLVKAAAAEYKGRGKPARSTKWSAVEIIRFMKWKVGTAGPNTDLGAKAAELPKAKGSTPAPMPTAVVEWEAFKPSMPTGPSESEPVVMRKAPKPKPDTRVSSIPQTFPSSGYELTFQPKSVRPWVLQHPDHSFGLELVDDQYELYQDSNGEDVIMGSETGPSYCQDLMTASKSGQWRDSAAPQLLLQATQLKSQCHSQEP